MENPVLWPRGVHLLRGQALSGSLARRSRHSLRPKKPAASCSPREAVRRFYGRKKDGRLRADLTSSKTKITSARQRCARAECAANQRAQKPYTRSRPRDQDMTPSANTVNSTTSPAMIMKRKKRSILRKASLIDVTENRSRSTAYRGAGAMEQAMINDRPVVKDPIFWITMTIGFSPILLGAVILFWFV